MDMDNVQSDVAYFSEQEEAKSILDEISYLSNRLLFTENFGETYSGQNKEIMLTTLISKVDTISEIITKYLNIEVLLYQYIETLIGDIFDIIKRLVQFPTSKKAEIITRNGSEKSTPLIVLEKICYYLYIISKCVGIRRLINYAPNEVSLFEKITETIEIIQDSNVEISDNEFTKYEDHLWCVEYIFLSWQSLLIYTPFELNTIWQHAYNDKLTFQTRILSGSMYYLNKSTKARDGAAMVISNLFSRRDVLNSQDFHFFLNLCQNILTNPDYNGSSIDSNNEEKFIKISDSSNNANNHLSISFLMVLKQIVKRVDTSDLRPYLDIIQFCLFNCDHVIVNSATKKLLSACLGRLAVHFLPPEENSQKYRRKCIELFNNVNSLSKNIEDEDDNDGETTVDYENNFDTERVELFLSKILLFLTDSDGRVRWASAKSLGRISSRLPVDLNEEIVEHIIESINSQFNQIPNTPNANNQQTSGSPLNNSDPNSLNLVMRQLSVKSESVVHGGCLAIAEILRKGLIHPHMLDKVLDTTILSLSFEVWRGKGSAGTAVRDASCFICWAIARTFTKEMLSFDHVSMISRELVNVSLFDSSVNCRRAACSALQELLGRIGTVPKGLELIQMCNFYTVSNRKKAFVDVCRQVATLGYYSNSMLQNIITTKLFHPDLSTRELASLAIYKILSSTDKFTISNITNYSTDQKEFDKSLSTINKDENTLEYLVNYLIKYFLSHLMTGLTATTHGALRALTKLISFVIEKNLSVYLFFSSVLNVPVTFEKKRLFRGKGSTIIRQSICKLITVNCKLILHVYSSEFYKDFNQLDVSIISEYVVVLKDSLRNFALEVQLASVEAFEQLFLIISGTPKFNELLTFFFNSLSSKGDHIAARRGYALVFSSIPILSYGSNTLLDDQEAPSTPEDTPKSMDFQFQKTDRERLNKMLRLLCKEIKTNPSLEIVRDAKTRQFALLSILSIISRTKSGFVFDKDILQELTDTLVFCCNDHEIDSRGDVGSWIRELSSEAIVYILHEYLFKNSQNNSKGPHKNLFSNLNKDMATSLTRGLVSLSLENLEHVRSRSTFLFCHLFTNKLSKFNFKWIWNRIFFNVPYENLISSNALDKYVGSPTTAVDDGVNSTTASNGTNQDLGSVEYPSLKGSSHIHNPISGDSDAADEIDNSDDENVDHEIQMYINENIESNMYINIDNKLLDGFNMLHDISKKLVQVITQYCDETNVQSEKGEDSVSVKQGENGDDGASEESDSETNTEDHLEYSVMSSDKINVVLRIAGWSAAPLTFNTLLWVVLIPSYVDTAFESIVNIIGQNTRLEVTLHSSKTVMVLEDVLVEFISKNKDTLIVFDKKPCTLEQVLKQCSVKLYKDTVNSNDCKTSMRLINTLKILFSHRLLQVGEWSELINLSISEVKVATNYAYLKSMIRFLQVILMDDASKITNDVLQTLISLLSHQYPTIRSYVASHLTLALSSRSDRASEKAIDIIDSCSFQVESLDNSKAAIQKLRSVLKL